MALFPDKRALGAGPSLRVERRLPPTGGTAPLAEAADTLGRTVASVGAVFEKRAADAESFDAQARLIDFKDRWAQRLTERQREMEPGAAGFRDAIQREFLDDADAFHASLPRHLRPELTLKLREFESQIVGTAGRIETAEGERFELGRIDEAHKKLLARVAQNPGALSAALAESDALIDASTRLTAVQKDALKPRKREQLNLAGIGSSIRSDPAAARYWAQARSGDGRGDVSRPGTSAPRGDAPAGGSPGPVAPDEITEEGFARIQPDARARYRQFQLVADDAAVRFVDDALHGRRNPEDLAGVADSFRRLGMKAKADYYDFLAGHPVLFSQWQNANAEQQRAILLRLSAPVMPETGGPSGDRQARLDEANRTAEAEADDLDRRLKDKTRLDEVLPSLQELLAFAQVANNGRLASRIERIAKDGQFLELLRSLPSAAQEQALIRMRNETGRDGPDLFAAQRYDMLKADHDRYVAALDRETFDAVTSRFRLEVLPLPDIAQATPQTRFALRSRADLAALIAEREPNHTRNVLPFSGEEMRNLTATLNGAPVEARMRMLDVLRDGLGEKWFVRTLKGIDADGHGALAWAGGLVNSEPRVARAILEGRDVQQAYPKIVPAGRDLTHATDRHVRTALSEGKDARRMVDDAVKALYAKIAFAAGKTDGSFDPDIADQAIKQVVGNVIYYRGIYLLPPDRRMTATGWQDGIVDKITDADLPDDLRTWSPNGLGTSRIDAARIRSSATFHSVGHGQYIVRLPGPDGIPGDIPDPTPEGRAKRRPWILDVREIMRRPAATANPQPVFLSP